MKKVATTTNKNKTKGKENNAKKNAANDQKKKKEQVAKLDEYLNDSGLGLAFKIIFAELVSKGIPQKDFFTYTSTRLKELGKEVEGLKTKDIIYVPKPKPPEPEGEEGEDDEGEEGDEEGVGEEVFLTGQDKKK